MLTNVPIHSFTDSDHTMDNRQCVDFLATEVSDTYSVSLEEAAKCVGVILQGYLSQNEINQGRGGLDFLSYGISIISAYANHEAFLKFAGNAFHHSSFQEIEKKWNAAVARLAEEHNSSGNCVFKCRRCRSSRVTVTTMQVRSADEGMTEFRSCKDCGHVGRINA